MPTPPSERNLLFAVLALQNELAQPDAVLASMQAWVAAKHRSLGELLVEGGAIEPTDRQLLDALIERQLARHGNAEQSLVALDPSSRARRLLAQVTDPDVQASLAALPASDSLDSTLQGEPAQAGPRYRVLRPHAAGGLGEVFVAEDLELHREVALKEIKREHALREDSRVRFLLEAEITGGLEHPGIVPVYGLGTYGDGRPFYAMRFIKGDNLKAAIERFHALEPVRFESLEFRQLLGRFVDVCQAVAYAHSRGVLHRDLKPGNVMLGKFGETLVVDWGLAKVIGRPGDGEVVAHEEATLRPSSGSGVAETVAGSAVGTPAFMSPEQAAGRLEQLGPATDVYGLGATLYMLLTNRPPFEGSAGEVLEQVRRGSWLPARAVKAGVPAALEAICGKAMALKPEERYASPSELAEELEHWLGDEPVAAYREPLAVRLGRWGRRHKPLVAGAAAFLAAAVVALTTGMILLGRAKNEIAKAEQQARKAVDDSFLAISENTILKSGQPGLEPLREQLLKSHLEYYKRFVEQHGEDRSLRAELAQANLRVGRIIFFQNRNREALLFCRKAHDLYRQLLTEEPQNDSHLAGLAVAARLIAVALERLTRGFGRSDAANPAEMREAAVEATELGRQLVQRVPDNPRHRADLGMAYNGYATISERHIAEFGEADKAYLHAEDTLQEAIRRCPPRDPDLAEFRFARCTALFSHGWLLHRLGRTTRAGQLDQEAITEFRRYRSKDNLYAPFRDYYWHSLNNLGYLQFTLGNYDDAQKTLQDALQECDRNPGLLENLGDVQVNLGRFDEGLRAAQEVLARAEKRARDTGETPVVSGIACRVAAKALRGLHKPQEAFDMINQAIKADTLGGEPIDFAAYELAACQALASALIQEEPSLVPVTERETRAAALADQSLATLKRAVATGWRFRQWMEKDPDLEAIRGRPEFKSLMATLPDDADQQE